LFVAGLKLFPDQSPGRSSYRKRHAQAGGQSGVCRCRVTLAPQVPVQGPWQPPNPLGEGTPTGQPARNGKDRVGQIRLPSTFSSARPQPSQLNPSGVRDLVAAGSTRSRSQACHNGVDFPLVEPLAVLTSKLASL
jgi:hypothetical protein